MKSLRFATGMACVLALLFTTSLALADTMGVAYRGTKSITYWVDGNQRNALTAEFYTPGTYQDIVWFGYCLDPAQSFKSPITPGDPSLWSGPEISPPVTNYDWRETAWLMENYAPGMDWLQDPGSVNYGSSAVKLAIQAVQLAIWEVTLDHAATYSPGDLTNSSSRFYVLSGQAAALAGSYLVALSEYKIAHGGNISLNDRYLINDQGDRQDLIMGSDTPEPATLLLMASALAVGGRVLRRGRQKA